MPPIPGADRYPGRDHLSITALAKLARCPRLFFYNEIIKDSPGPAQMFGTALHAVWPLVLSEGLESAMAEFDRIWTDPPGETLEKGPWKARNRARAEAMLASFAEAHDPGNRLYTLVEPPGAVAAPGSGKNPWELEYLVDLGLTFPDGTPLPLYGWIDGLARMEDTGDLYAVEVKTSSEVSDRFMRQLSASPQAVGYPWALRQHGLDVKGTILEVLRVSPSQTQTATEPFPVSDVQLELFDQWAKFQGTLWLEYVRTGVWPQNMAACSPLPSFGTAGIECPWTPLCHEVRDWQSLEDLYSDQDREGFVPLTIDGA